MTAQRGDDRRAGEGHFEPHALVVTVDRCSDCKDQSDLCQDCAEHPELNYAIECPGVTDACRAWWECRETHTEDDLYRMEEEEPIHGVLHQLVAGMWSTPGTECFVQIADSVPEEGEYVSKGAPGRYLVDFDFGDPGEVYLHEIKPAEATS